MVAPQIAAGGRVAAGSARVTKGVAKETKYVTAANDPRRSAILRNRSLQRQVKDLNAPAGTVNVPRLLQGAQNTNRPPTGKLKLDRAAKEISRKARLAGVNAANALILVSAYAVQLMGWLIYFGAEYIKTYWIIQQVDTYVVDLDWIKYVGWAVGTTAGLFALGWMAGAYSTAFINWMRGLSMWVFIFCAALYFAPHLLLVPWIVLWMTYVFWSRSQ